MRVLLVGAAVRPDNMERHVLSTLVQQGHGVQHFNARDVIGHAPAVVQKYARAVLSRLLREPELLVEKRLLQTAEKVSPDLVLVLLGSMLSPKTVAKLKKQVRVPVVCWCQDAMTTLARQYLIGSDYDFIFMKDQYLVDRFRALAGLNVHYLAEACNPEAHYRTELSDAERADYACDVCTYGNLYYYRQRLLESLGEFDVKFWGTVPSWLSTTIDDTIQGRAVHEHEKVKALSGARVVLNSLHFAEVGGLNVRCFEVAGCGAFQLVTETPALHRHFEVGAELDVFASADELRSKIRRYLAEPERRAEMALAAQRRAYAEHTYEHRLTELFDRVGGGVLRDP